MYAEAKDEIKSKLAIEDIVGEYVQLKRAGRYFRGLSPFTNEKTPSFFVTPDRDMWYDFSAGRGGDIFSFIMEVEGLDFVGAMELLAKKANVDLSRYSSRGGRSLASRKERIYQINNLALNYFQRELVGSSRALDYAVSGRHLQKETIVQWGIGYSPECSSLKQLLIDKGYRIDELKDAGVVGYNGRDLFYNRLMIPLRDRQGQVVGFTGRIIGDGQPKYLNTPETIVYHKGRQLFGLNFAIQPIRKVGYSVVVEGNLDVISSHQAGVKNVVGVAGTGLTVDHLKSLARLAPEVRFCFDSDKAGVAATEKAIKLAGSFDLKLSVVDYSDQGVKDPDELINRDPNLWKQSLEQPQLAVNWVRDYYVKTVGIGTVDGKKVVVAKTLAVVNALTDPVEQEGYIKELGQIVGISTSTLMKKLSQINIQDNDSVSTRIKKEVKTPRLNSSQIPREQRFRYLDNALAYLESRPNLRSKYLGFIEQANLSEVNIAVINLLKETDLSGEGLITELDNLDITDKSAIRDKLIELQLLNYRAATTVEGIRSEEDLLDYLCHYEQDYYINSAKKLLAKALSLGPGDELANKLSRESRAARRIADSLDPRKNRHNNYQGLRDLWSVRNKQ